MGVLDLVYLVPESVALWEMLQALETELQRAQAEGIHPAGGDGMLHSAGLEFKLSGIAVKLLLANDLDVSSSSPENVNSRVAATIARVAACKILESAVFNLLYWVQPDFRILEE
ncbi:unnamed protein product [Effrenium voratum]|uniref:Uncharacterized protein n=1 Tax=Effrenium voratum TaxID=2562239 RepID=A0AA36ICR2_9DINO|nr:unnamed protein product [Effrenium voratum]